MSFDDGENQTKVRSYVSSVKNPISHRRLSSGHNRGREHHVYEGIFRPTEIASTPSSKKLKNTSTLLRKPLTSTQQGSAANISGSATSQSPPSKRSRLTTDTSVSTAHAECQTDSLQLEVQLAQLRKDFRELKELYAVKSDDFRKMEAEVEKQKIDMEKYREDSKTAIRRYHKKCKEYVDLEQSTSKLYSQLEAVKKESKNVQEQKDAKHEKLMEESRVRLDQLSRENEMLLKELESQSKALQEQKSHQDASIQKLKEEHDRTLQKLKDDFANEAVRAAQAWKNQSIQRLAELNGVVKHLKDEVTEKQQLLLSANAQTELQKIETRTALQTVEELKSTNSQLLKEQKQLKDERDKWIQQHTDTKDQLNNRAKHIADLEREMESLRRDSNNWNHWYHQFFAPTVSNMPSFNSSDSTFGNLLTPEQIETSSVENLPVNLRLLNIKKIG